MLHLPMIRFRRNPPAAARCVPPLLSPIACVLLVVLVLVVAGCGDRANVLVLHGATMGTTYNIKLADPPEELDPGALQQRIDALLDEVNGLMSTYRPGSELSRFNASPSTDWYPVSPELVRVVAAAQEVSKATDGAFDVTVGPLVNLWGFGPDMDVSADQLPSAADVEAARIRVGYRQLEVRRKPPALRKSRPDLYVDLSAIAKGYGVDRVAALIADAGIANALVEIGGELHGRGHNGQGEPWRIAVERPDPGVRRALRVVPLNELGMATSGDYRNFFEVDGKRYSHTIDPATGRPVQHDLASVTVLAESAMTADAWATALLVLGPEAGLAKAQALDLPALLIRRTGDELVSEHTPAFDALTTAPDGG
jgi:thiamine biosynthesis lipoprotein